MPLTNCPDCGREVSTRAQTCVHCGRPWPSCGNLYMIKFLVLGLVAALVAMFFVVRHHETQGFCGNSKGFSCTEPCPSSETPKK